MASQTIIWSCVASQNTLINRVFGASVTVSNLCAYIPRSPLRYVPVCYVYTTVVCVHPRATATFPPRVLSGLVLAAGEAGRDVLGKGGPEVEGVHWAWAGPVDGARQVGVCVLALWGKCYVGVILMTPGVTCCCCY